MKIKNHGGIMEKSESNAVLFTEAHKTMLNPFGKPVAGWIPGTKANTMFNPMGYGTAWITICNQNGDPLYNQPMIVENPGVVVICKLGERIGLIPIDRMNSERIIPNSGDYVKTINEENLWEKLVTSLGKTTWEAPKGLITSTDEENLDSLVLRTAKIEALQEAGFRIKNSKILGRINTNSTFFCHAQYAVYAEIESIRDANPEDTEMIGRAKLFTLPEIAEMQKRGEFEDSLTLSAMALCGLSLPL